jgi:hypothetical protein
VPLVKPLCSLVVKVFPLHLRRSLLPSAFGVTINRFILYTSPAV